MRKSELTDYEMSMLDRGNTTPEGIAFRRGAEAEARTRKESILPHLREFFETAEVVCQNYTDQTPSDVANTLHFIFTTPKRKSWWERNVTRPWAAAIALLSILLVGIDTGMHHTWPVEVAYIGGIAAGIGGAVLFLVPPKERTRNAGKQNRPRRTRGKPRSADRAG